MHESFWSCPMTHTESERASSTKSVHSFKAIRIFNFSTTHHCSKVGWNQCGDPYDLQGERVDLVVEDKWGWPESLCSWYGGY